MPISAKVQKKLNDLKSDLLQLTTVGKTVGASVLGGAATSGFQLLQHIDQEALFFTHAGLIKLKHAFISGAAITLLGYFLPTPLKATFNQNQPQNQDPK